MAALQARIAPLTGEAGVGQPIGTGEHIAHLYHRVLTDLPQGPSIGIISKSRMREHGYHGTEDELNRSVVLPERIDLFLQVYQLLLLQ